MKSSKSKALNSVFTVLLSILSVAYIYPIFMILINSLKQELSITTETAFVLPSAETFAGLENYVNAIQAQGFLKSLGFSLFITISSVAAILLFCSMSAWYIARINSVFSNVFYYLCVFSMVVPFQMVMYTLSATADRLKLNTPWNIWIIYLGFGAGLAVFMITGFMKGIPLEIEEAAMIDGCTPIQTFFSIVLNPIYFITTVNVPSGKFFR